MNAKVFFPDVLEASAYVVCLVQMAGKDYAPNITRTEKGFEVELLKPVSFELHEGIMRAIKHDKETNPKKWEETRASLKESNNNVSSDVS